MRPLLILRSGPTTAPVNMATDEALLLRSAHTAAPVLRFYSWSEPAASFGYFQRYADVQLLTHLRPLIRRPTGGGLVPHDADWTYSLALPVTDRWHALPARETYRLIHQWICDAFALLGIPTTLAPSPLKTGPGQCFAGYEQFDLLCRGRKIAGAAQRRNRDGLLIQGSVQPPSEAQRAPWERAMLHVAPDLQFQPRDFLPDPDFQATVTRLHNDKYASPQYNQKR